MCCGRSLPGYGSRSLGAVSTRAITSLDGYVEFTSNATDEGVMAGLSHGDVDQNYTDIDFVRKRYTMRERVALWNHRSWRFFGFGLAFFFFLEIPLLNILTGAFVIPCAAVGGTLLYLELDQK